MMGPDLEFVSEVRTLIDAIRGDLADWDDQFYPATPDMDLIQRLFRSLHSLKGLSASVGLQNAASLAHALEGYLDDFRMGRRPLFAGACDLLSRAVTVLESLANDCPDAVSRSMEIMTMLEEEAVRSRIPMEEPQPSPPDLDEELLQALTAFEAHRLQTCLAQGKDVFLFHCCIPLSDLHTALAGFEECLRAQGEYIATIPGMTGDDGRIDFHLLFSGPIPGNISEHFPAAYRLRVRGVSNQTSRNPPRPAASDRRDGVVSSGGVRIDCGKLEEMLEVCKCLVLEQGHLKRRFQQLSHGDAVETGEVLERSFREMERGLLRLQRSLNDARMVPVRYLFQRMSRVVRSARNDADKRVRLVMRGNEVPLDRGVLEALQEPLLHLVRNAVDHGIEPMEERIACGKPAEGTIVLEARLRGGQITLEVRDDGRGIDPERVRNRALALGMLDADEACSEHRLYDLLFQPGFSTREAVSEVSGRGIGMDVVRCRLDSLCGQVKIDSRHGRGTGITMILPVHKTIMPVLVVKVLDRSFALALESVRSVKPYVSGAGKEIDGEAPVATPLPMLDLERHFFGGKRTVAHPAYLVTVGWGDEDAGIIVDGLPARREAVVRPFDRLLRQIPGFSAVAELINAGPVLLLDPGYLIDAARGCDPSGDIRSAGSVEVGRGVPTRDCRDERPPENKGNLISLFVGGDEYALDIMDVVEIIEDAEWIPVPRASSFVGGIFLWRDRIVPVMDIGARLGVGRPHENCSGTLFVCHCGDQKIAVVVERMGQRLHVGRENDDLSVNLLPETVRPFLARVARNDGRVIGIFNLAAILDYPVTV